MKSFDLRKKFIINLSILYLGSFTLLHLVTSLMTKWVASLLFNIPSDFHRLGLIFTIPDSSPKWDHSSVILIYLTAPAVAAVIAAFCVKYFYSKVERYRSLFKLFVIFLYLHAVNLFFGGLAIGAFLKKGFGFVPRWMGFDDVLIYIMAGISVVILIINGFLLKSYISAYGYSYDHYNEDKDQLLFKLLHFLLPITIISLAMFLIGVPDNTLYLRLLSLTMLIQLPGLLPFKYVNNRPKENYVLTNKISRGAIWALVIFVGILIVVAL